MISEQVSNIIYNLEDEGKKFWEPSILSKRVSLVGNSDSMAKLVKQIKLVAPYDKIVHIHGESGTGKELIVKAIHSFSKRSKKELIRLNLSEIPEGLIESTLFGHEKGSFTDAIEAKDGKFLEANGGTIFLDEIGDISPSIQIKLLRVIQEKEIEVVGGSKKKIDVRLITATHEDLEELCNIGFRKDLYYRISGWKLDVPPLRERGNDIIILANHFLNCYKRKYKIKYDLDFSKDVKNLLLQYKWPGNVRELENAIENAFIRKGRSRKICREHLDQNIVEGTSPFEEEKDKYYSPFEDKHVMKFKDVEKLYHEDLNKKVSGNKSEATKLSGLSYNTISKKWKEYVKIQMENDKRAV